MPWICQTTLWSARAENRSGEALHAQRWQRHVVRLHADEHVIDYRDLRGGGEAGIAGAGHGDRYRIRRRNRAGCEIVRFRGGAGRKALARARADYADLSERGVATGNAVDAPIQDVAGGAAQGSGERDAMIVGKRCG